MCSVPTSELKVLVNHFDEHQTQLYSFDTLEAICRELECTPNDIIVSDDPTVSRLLLYADKMQRGIKKDDSE
ncbi:helix-turn-helix domain-containing protein [Lacrimispora sp. BS-2]|uniref:helix-turn-helix domain-containing protein n=1 Tax=Lacrimispora sp. BS-2 TaxID=3151850 RepID=UPI0032EBE70B